MDNFDIIVIGAGLGGLTAAACATKEGKRVLVLEKGLTPGGSATSFTRGRFEFEASLHALSGFSNSQGVGDVRIIFDELGITNKIEWCEPKNAFRIITKSKNGERIDATLPFGIENFINTIEEYAPGSRASLEKLFDLAEKFVNMKNPSEPQLFYIWGHTFEFDYANGGVDWQVIEDFCKLVSNKEDIYYCTNKEAFKIEE